MNELALLALILGITTAITLLLRTIKQPPLVSYILAGVFLGPSILGLTDANVLHVFSKIGIAFLLFIVGINLDVRSLKQVGNVSILTGLGQVVFTGLFGYILGGILGFTSMESTYIAIALTFSSTIIIIKLFSDKKELDTLHGRVATGFLLIQDFIAVLCLLTITTISTTETTIALTIGYTLIFAVALFVGAILVQRYILTYLLSQAGKNAEVLFLFSIAWCFIIANLFGIARLGIEVGALIAGVMLASTPYRYEIASKIKPLRDFFIIIFFIILGSQIHFSEITQYTIPILVYSLFVLILNPLLVIYIMSWFGFTKRTSFYTSLAVAQISEFSLLIVALGVSVGHVSQEILSLVTVIGLITILVSTYLILYAETVYNKIHPLIPYKKRGVHKVLHPYEHKMQYETILIGYSRMGYTIAEHLQKNNQHTLIIDYNPERVDELQKKGKNAILADANDAELYAELRIEKIRVLVSTVVDAKLSSLLIQLIRKRNKKATLILSCARSDEAIELYEQGADYVIVPHLVGGDHATILLDAAHTNLELFAEHKEKHIKKLHTRK